ncbi:ATP-binding protein [Streptomyces sp. JJ36]|uniref:ATP-binding protein n=1 Tax=Streptomyces sp. JJ36 TaxID=2736645 RepID=UPI001F1C96DC|nr:ATP-binding protein [Streptomyces sp. JJ36]MCF6525133.1 ATP-binding protein [Streptomyces sp. JJ36]
MASPHEALSVDHRAGPALARPLRDAFHLPAVDTSVAEARHRVLDRLRAWGVAEQSCEDAELLVSELFTNAVRHTDSEKVGCELWMIGVRLRLEVTDEGGNRGLLPRTRSADADGEGGRGLLLVSVLADEWGIRPDDRDQGHAVWAELPCARVTPQ